MKLSEKFEEYLYRKVTQQNGGRPHFLAELGKQGRIVKEEALNIVELAWLKHKSVRKIARKYNTGYDTIRRFLNDLEALDLKEELVELLMTEPRRKAFYNKETETSDFETVQNYIDRCKRRIPPVKKFKRHLIGEAFRAWKALNRKDPKNWTAQEVMDYLKTLPYGAASGTLDAIRQICPQIADEHSPQYIETGQFRARLKRHKKDIFAKEVGMIITALRYEGLTWEETIFKLHVALGAREGASNSNSGMSGLRWSYFHKKFTRVDLWESKVRGSLWSRDCPVGLLFSDLPMRLHNLWIDRAKPTEAKLIQGGYNELSLIYKRIVKACVKHWKGKTEPDILNDFATLKPHDADRIHVNLLWEANVPLEVVAGQDLGQGEALGLVGRVWLSVDTIKKYYLSLTQRSDRFKRIEDRVKQYGKQFNGKKGIQYVA